MLGILWPFVYIILYPQRFHKRNEERLSKEWYITVPFVGARWENKYTPILLYRKYKPRVASSPKKTDEGADDTVQAEYRNSPTSQHLPFLRMANHSHKLKQVIEKRLEGNMLSCDEILCHFSFFFFSLFHVFYIIYHYHEKYLQQEKITAITIKCTSTET